MRKNLVGQRFGRLIAVESVGYCGRNIKWKCVCDCGNETTVSSSHLGTKNPTRSCGCLHTKTSLIGQRFGKLVVFGKHTSKNKWYELRWLCKCDCGKESIVSTHALRQGVGSCGCSRIILPKGVRSMHKAFQTYKDRARIKGYEFLLGKADFERLTQNACFYCGALPSNRARTFNFNGDYIYNGIDRMDNTRGYVLDNCVSCCFFCNRAKGTKSQQEFYLWITSVYMIIKGEINDI